MLYKIYYSSENVIFVESLLHQLINSNFNIQDFLNKISFLYGNPKLKLVFLDCPVDEALNRMIKRGDNFEIKKCNKKRYLDSNFTHNYIFKYLEEKYIFIFNMEKPLKLYSKYKAYNNAKILLSKLKYNYLFLDNKS